MSDETVRFGAGLSLSSYYIDQTEVGDGIEFEIEANAGAAPRATVSIYFDESRRGVGCMSRGCQRDSEYVLVIEGHEARVCAYHFELIRALALHFAGSGEEGSVNVQPH